MHQAQISDVDDDFDGATQTDHCRLTWSFLVDALIRRFLTNGVLQSTHDAATRSVRDPSGEEGNFSKAARLCLGILPKSAFPIIMFVDSNRHFENIFSDIYASYRPASSWSCNTR